MFASLFTKTFVTNLMETSGIFDFINADLESVFGKNKWFMEEYVNIYLRNYYKFIAYPKPNRVLDYAKHPSICIASISIPEEFQRQGLGSLLINTIHESHNKSLTLVEQADNKHLEDWLVRNEWIRLDKFSPTYYKHNPNYKSDSIDLEEES